MHEFENCIVENEEGDGLAEGYVTRCDQKTITVSLSGGCVLRRRQPVSVCIYSLLDGESRYEAEVVSVDSEFVDFAVRRFRGAVNRRQATRIPLHLHTRVYYRFDEEKKSKLDAPFDITVLNLSATGMLFSAAARLEEGFRFPLSFAGARRTVELTAEVLRREDLQRSSRYGCIFRGLGRRERNEIEYFILRERMRNRRRGF